jgi:DNA-binding winged helix-turn-helix (wHTH) protein
MSSTELDSHPFPDKPIVEFDSYILNVGERSLMRAGQEINLEPKTLDLLLYLVRRRNSLVTKDEIFESVWHSSFVEEANLPVHISRLRKIFADDDPSVVVIETVPRSGYRLKIEGEVFFRNGEQNSGNFAVPQASSGNGVASGSELVPDVGSPSRKRSWRPVFATGVLSGVILSAIALLAYHWLFPPSKITSTMPHSFKTVSCPRDASTSNLAVGGCDEAVTSFTLSSNPNGNWSYGYTPKDAISNFVLFDRADHNNHYGSPEIPVDWWHRSTEWHPLILRNTSTFTIVIQGGIVLAPNMFEIHPGPNGERSDLRWTAPADGHYRAQGQFRGINTNGYTSTDALVVENGRDVRFSAEISGYDEETPFDLTFKLAAGQTIDFSAGYGSNHAYEGDSTGFSVIITTISLSEKLSSTP